MFAGVIAAVALPFLIADPVAFYEDTVKFGAGTYKIVGYGLSAMLDPRGDPRGPRRLLPVRADRAAHLAAAHRLAVRAGPPRRGSCGCAPPAFSISILVLLFIGRTFNNYYLVWPMTGAMVAALIYASERAACSFCCCFFFGFSSA